jgi:Protein of unknown function (DUF4229)
VGPVLKYSTLRLALFLLALLGLYLAGARGLLLLVLAALVSLALSFVLLRGPRAEMAETVAERTRRRLERSRTDPDAAAEDDEAGRGRR